jgi:hypothetical protein
MKHFLLLLVSFCLAIAGASAQTYWKGTTSTSWSTASNWSNGVPTASVAAILGDATYFTGSNQPTIGSSAVCASLTIGGTKATTLTISKNLSVGGAVTINSNGTLNLGKATMTVSGSWTNNGSFSTTHNAANNTFSGTAQTVSGSSSTTFRKLTINAGAVLTVSTAISASTSITVNGTLVPGATVAIGGSVTVSSTGTIKVTGALMTTHYSSPTLQNGSTVEYNSAGAQTIYAGLTYSTLRIAGTGTRSLAANVNNMNSAGTSYGNVYVDAGTLDLGAYTLNRGTTTTGGTFSVSNGATVRIGSTATFPSGYNTNTLSLTSTVEYYGADQSVSAKTYGNLLLSGTGIKTFPLTAVSTSGSFTTSGTVTANMNANLTVGSITTVDAGTTINGGAFTLQAGASVVNNGAINGNTGTLTLSGAGATVSGAGTFALNNLTVLASGTNTAVNAISLTGNLATTGSGVFTFSGGTLTMTGSGKTISGSNIVLNNLSVPSGSVSATSGFTLTGNLAVGGSFDASGILVMSGSSKTISGSGTINFTSLSATGSLTTASSFNISNTLDVSGSLTASAGTVTFKSVSLLNGTASLYNVTLNGTSLQLAANSQLGIAGAFTLTAGSFDATTTTPNTVVYNSTGAQSVAGGITYDNLTLSNGSTKTALGAISTNTDLTISAGTTFAAASYAHTVKGNWNNYGSFTAGTCTVAFTGANDATLTGATTFNTLTINKTSSTNSVFLANNITTPTLNMSNGVLRTQTSRIIITSTRTGNGYIYGTIERSHSFSSGTDYAFESSNNLLNFTGASGITGVTMVVTQGSVSTFPFGSAINRSYTVSLAAGTYTSASLRMHYEDAELNGNSESNLQLYRYNGSSWTNSGVTGSSGTSNYAEQSGIGTITGTWTLSSTSNVVTWNGSISSDWNTAANWTNTQGTPSMPPSLNDIVQLGTSAFSNQPTISGAANAKSILFGSAQAVTLTLASGGSLTTQGNISGNWSSNVTHTIDAGAQTLAVNGSLLLSDGTSGHAINLNIGTGSVAITGSLTQSGGANITFIDAGNLNIGGDFTYTSGTFTAGSGTVTYNGGNFQSVGGVTYNQLVINKTAATATAGSTTVVNGNLTVTAGTFDFSGPTTILGNVTIAAAGIATNRTTISIGGNWNNNGSYLPAGGAATFNGTGSQSVMATSFNKVIVNKASGTLTLAGNITLNSDFQILAGTVDMGTYTANRNTLGGTLQVANGASLLIGGTANFPANYTYYTFGISSTTTYNGSSTQSVGGVTYGNLVFSNGGSNAKTLLAPATVGGNLTISAGATFDGSAHNLTLNGNWTNSGTFTPSTGAVLAYGIGKTISGTSTFNKLTVYGTYTVDGSNITYNGVLTIADGGSFNAGPGTAVLYGNLTNSGSLTSNGTTTFMGTQTQTIRLLNAIVSNSTGIINFNGTVAPVLNSTSTPIFATLNINNTGGISPSVNWAVGVACTIASSASFNGGTSTHTFYGNFTNNGIVTSEGGIQFTPTAAATAALGANSGGNTFSSTGTVTFGGTGALAVTGTPTAIDHVIIGNTTGVTPTSGWTGITGTFSINSNAIFNAGSYSYSLAGNMESNGTLNGGTSLFTFTANPAQISGSPATTFYDLAVSTALTVNSEFNVSHDLTMNGTIDASVGGIAFTGSSNGNITGSASTLTLSNFSVEKSGATLYLQKALAGLTDLSVSSGVLDMGNFTIGTDLVNTPTTLIISNGARLRIANGSLPGFTQFALDSLSVVEYYGSSSQALTPAVTYGCLEVTNGPKTTAAALTVQKHLTVTAGSLALSTYTHNVGGDWLQTGGTVSSTGTINFNGIAAQSVTATDAFNNITVNSTNNLTLGSLVKVTGTLAFTTGKVILGSYNLLPATISGASSSNYVVASGSGVLRQAIAANGSKAFPVGTSSAYIPATVTFTAGLADSIGVRVLPATYNNGETGTALTNFAVNATWMIEEKDAANANTATVTLQWPASLELPNFSRGTARMAHYVGGAWDYGTAAIAASGANPYTLTRTGFTSFSPFSVRMNNAVLPVTWLNFSAQRRAGTDILAWSTASESNTARFDVEESSDGSAYHLIGSVAAAGNSSSVQSYSYSNSGVQGTRYYRIRQVDRDGRYTYSNVVRLNEGAATTGISLKANPVRGNATLQLQLPGAMDVQLSLHDANGRLLWSKAQQLGAGSQSLIAPTANFPAGVYYLNAYFGEGTRQTVKLVKE